MAKATGKLQTVGLTLSSVLMLVATSSIVAFLINSLVRHLKP